MPMMPSPKPNIILINCDDLGYGDLGCYGSTLNRTPALDHMAAEGVRFTDFYMASSVCSPSRGAMMTGCYPPRIGFDNFQGYPVLFPGQGIGLNPEEKSVATYLRELGYATKLVGKWHCGDQPEFLPTQHGFDSYFGLPYSNDMGRQVHEWDGWTDWFEKLKRTTQVDYSSSDQTEPEAHFPPLPLLQDQEIIEEQPDQSGLTDRYVHEAVNFLRENQDRPFFLYFAHMYVHLPIYVPEPYLNESQNGRYGAAVEHVDASVDTLLSELETLGLDEQTMVIFTSDNGSRANNEGGSNGPLRGAKGSTFEGGQRVPCIVRWPGSIQPGQVNETVASAIDFLPTLVDLAGGEVDAHRAIDGRNLAGPLRGEERSDEIFFYYWMGNLCAVRRGKWKLHFRNHHEEFSALYNLERDIGETEDVKSEYPEIIVELSSLAEKMRYTLGDEALEIQGCERRPIGQVSDPDTLSHFDPQNPYTLMEYDLSDAG